MKKHTMFCVLGIVLIFVSVPFAYFSINVFGQLKGNLTSEYVPLLMGFIGSYLSIGILVFIYGFVNKIKQP